MFVKDLTFPVAKIKGIGKVSAADFASLSVEKASDLITLFPRSYDDRTRLSSLNEIGAEGGKLNSAVEIVEHSHYMSRGQRVLKMTCRELSSGRTLYLHCFGRSFMESAYPAGTSWFINADVTRTGSVFSASSFTLGASEEQAGLGRILPVYPLSGSLTQKAVRRAVNSILSVKYIRFDDELPLSLIEKHGLLHTDEAIRQIHNPQNAELLDRAKKTLAYTELFYLELKLLRTKDSAVKTGPVRPSSLEQKVISSLPFTLTADQEKCLDEIRADMDYGHMNRLLQGDVGSGKTLVAWLSALHIIAQGCQAAFMAPTELLARQHAEGAAQLLKDTGVRVAFLTGDVKGKERGYLLDALKKGEIDLAIGTHALFSKDVAFKKLGLVIIDEQHRFGVEQRQALSGKGRRVHVLMMSATPIPRTLAMTVFGSMDVSTIRTMPAGRKPVITHIVDEKNRERMYASISVEFSRGHQAYFVYPRIDDEGESSLKDVTSMFSFLQAKYPEVPEVGIDVPDATCMIIEHAERFGLAALHQLRGRVGRSSLQSWCFLVYYGNLTEEARSRLVVMRESTDGFRIAEEDLLIRGPGEFTGNRQSGYLRLKMASLTEDVELMAQAREDAQAVLAEDKGLISAGNSMIRQLLD